MISFQEIIFLFQTRSLFYKGLIQWFHRYFITLLHIQRMYKLLEHWTLDMSYLELGKFRIGSLILWRVKKFRPVFSPSWTTYLNFRFLVKTVCVSILCTCHGLSVHVTVCRYMSHFLGRLFLFVCDILSGRECCTSIVHLSDKVTDFYILAR